MTIFGQIVTGDSVETAVEATIRRWQSDYLGEVASQSGMDRGSLPMLRSFPRLLDLTRWDEDQTPSCVISAPGTLASRIKDRGLDVTWAVGIGCIVSAKDMPNTLRLAQLYTAAIRTLLLQHSSLGDFSDGISFVSERYDELDAQDSRSIASGVLQIGVDVIGISDLSQGPLVPSDDATLPVGTWPTVASVGVDVEKEN